MGDTALKQAVRMRGMSPRPADKLSEDARVALVKAYVAHGRAIADADEAWRKAVRAALAEGSVRTVAAALGVSPTTVQKWSKE